MGKHLDFPGAARRYFHNSNLSIKMILLQHESISRKGNHQSFNEHLGDSWRSSSIVRILQVEMERGKLLGTHCLSRFDLATVLWSISKFGASPCLRLGRILSRGICTALGTGGARKNDFVADVQFENFFHSESNHGEYEVACSEVWSCMVLPSQILDI